MALNPGYRNPNYYPSNYDFKRYWPGFAVDASKGGLPGPGGGGRRQPNKQDDEIIFAVANAFVRLMDDGT